MAGLDYLSNAPDDLQPEETEEQQRLRLLNAGPPAGRAPWWKPPSDIPAPRPIEDAVAPEPMDEPPAMPAVAAPPVQAAPPGIAPVDANVQKAQSRLQEVFGNKPQPKEPKWWQRALAGAAGFGAGYYNAEGKAGHIDPAAAEDVALGGPGNRRRLADWQHNVETAQIGAQGATAEREAWFKKNKEEADQRLQTAQAEHLGAQTAAQRSIAEREQNPWKVNTKTGQLYNPVTGEVKDPASTLAGRIKEAKAAGLSDEEAKIYATGGKLSAEKPVKENQINAVQLAIRAAGGNPEDPATITPAVAKRATEILKPQMPGIQLTPEAVQFWGQAAAQGVPLPSMGMGPSGAAARQAIINAAPGLSSGGTLAGNRAEQKADTTSLGAMTKMRDAVVAFENTANANLDIFQNAAKQVIDTGSPWINQPLRTVARQGLGSADLAAYDAARQVALTEISKVVNNPNLTGQLSDSARREVTGLIPENASLKQIFRVVGILRQDMANRRKYLDEGVQGIKGRLGGSPAASAPAQSGPKPFPAAQVHAYGVAHGLDDAAAQKAITAAGYVIQ